MIKKRIKTLCVGCITVFAVLSIFHTTVFAFANQYPAYLGDFGDCAYIELNTTNFGQSAIVLPVSYQTETLSFKNGKLYNVTANTLYGYIVTANGNSYDVRATRLSNLQYSITSGYQTQYVDISYTDILNTNVRFTNKNTDNEFVKVTPYETIIIVLLCVLCISELGNLIFSLVRNRYYA